MAKDKKSSVQRVLRDITDQFNSGETDIGDGADVLSRGLKVVHRNYSHETPDEISKLYMQNPIVYEV